jgi:secondary thiamine-phosphate synthase enzyme
MMFETISVSTSSRSEIVVITSQIQSVVSKSKVKNGICVIYNPHTTSAICINEDADPSVKRDILEELRKFIPENDGYHHSEGNADSHIKASLMGSSRVVIIRNGKLQLGTWQGIFFCEFDGPRSRKVYVQIISE